MKPIPDLTPPDLRVSGRARSQGAGPSRGTKWKLGEDRALRSRVGEKCPRTQQWPNDCRCKIHEISRRCATSSTTEEKERGEVGKEFSRGTQDRYAEELAEKLSEIEREGIFGGTCQRWRRGSIPGRDKNSKVGVDLLASKGKPDISKIAVVNQGRMWSVDQPSCG
jgi:hypothetical protein